MKSSFKFLALGILTAATAAQARAEIPPYEYTCKITQETKDAAGKYVHTIIQSETASLVANPITPQRVIETYTATLKFQVAARAGTAFSVDASASFVPDATLKNPIEGRPDIFMEGRIYNQVRTSVQGVSFDVPVKTQSLADFKRGNESLGNGPWLKYEDTAFYVSCVLKKFELKKN